MSTVIGIVVLSIGYILGGLLGFLLLREWLERRFHGPRRHRKYLRELDELAEQRRRERDEDTERQLLDLLAMEQEAHIPEGCPNWRAYVRMLNELPGPEGRE